MGRVAGAIMDVDQENVPHVYRLCQVHLLHIVVETTMEIMEIVLVMR